MIEKELNTPKYAQTSAYSQMIKVQKEPKPEYIWYGIPTGSHGLFVGAQKQAKVHLPRTLQLVYR